MLGQTTKTRRWSRQEYDRMIATGIFHPEERLELLEGEIIAMTPQGSGHATAVSLMAEALREVFGQGFLVRVQMPLALAPDSEPEPDVAVVVGQARDYRDEHPRTAVLVVAVADATLSLDRERKAGLYARAGIHEYWLLNLTDRCLEVLRDAQAIGSPDARYHSRRDAGASDSISPIGCPTASLPVTDLLP
jgi:Uma2 family endonuclease